MNKWSPVILEEFGNQRKTKTIPKAIAHCKETFEGGSHDHGIFGRGMVAAWERYNSTKSDTDPTKTKPVAELTKKGTIQHRHFDHSIAVKSAKVTKKDSMKQQLLEKTMTLTTERARSIDYTFTVKQTAAALNANVLKIVKGHFDSDNGPSAVDDAIRQSAADIDRFFNDLENKMDQQDSVVVADFDFDAV